MGTDGVRVTLWGQQAEGWHYGDNRRGGDTMGTTRGGVALWGQMVFG